MDRKGLMFRNLVAGIIVLIIAGILLLIVTNILNDASKIADRETCRTSVLLKAQSKILGKPLYDDLNCKTEVHELKTTNKEELYEFITYRMYDCWYQFGEGKKDFLSIYDFGDSDEWCNICARIDFSENVQDKYPEIKMEDFHNYLKTTTLPLREDQSFYEYFYGEIPGKIEGNIDDSLFVWNTDEPIYVSFLADHNRKYNASFWTEAAIAGGGIAFCAAGIAGAVYTVGTLTAHAAKMCYVGIGSAATSLLIMSSVKEEYIMGLDVSSGEQTTQWCNENR